MRNSRAKSNALIHRLKPTISSNGETPGCAVSNNHIDMLEKIATHDILKTNRQRSISDTAHKSIAVPKDLRPRAHKPPRHRHQL